MTFFEKYSAEKTWHGKAIVMEIYHLAMQHRNKSWTLTKTAGAFSVSIALVSENLKLAHAIHEDSKILDCASRQEALKKLNGRSMEAKRLRIAEELEGRYPE
jgi:hypothetical protein